MNSIRVLIWFPFSSQYYTDIFKKVKNEFDIECKEGTEFGDEFNYSSQVDFDRIISIYHPNIIFLYNVTAKKITINIPECIKVITYCDHFYEQLAILGRPYFESVPENNYLYMPILDADRIDKDGILEDRCIKDKIYFAPFVASLEKRQLSRNVEDSKKFACDISIVSSYKDITYYCWCFNINTYSFQGRVLFQFVSELSILIKRKIKKDNGIYIEDNWITEVIIETFDKLGLNQYVNDKEKFIRIWFNTVKYNVIPHEYNHCVVDWLIDKEYDIKIYGEKWDKSDKYKKYAYGAVQECSVDLNKIYQYSRINVGTNIGMGIHRRNIEVIENHCLCFQAYAGDEYMTSNYKHFFQDGQDIVIYRDKKDLYDKVDFYLSHDKEREQIIKAGQNVVEKYLRAEDVFGTAIKEIYEKE